MNHNWDVYSNTEYDTCIICTLRRKMVAQLKGLVRIAPLMFREYWINGKWVQPKDLGKIGRACPGIKTDYNNINIQK